MSKRSSTPTDESRLAKWIVDHVTIEAKAQPEKNPAAAAQGRMSRLKERKTGATKLTSAKRKAIAKKANPGRI